MAALLKLAMPFWVTKLLIKSPVKIATFKFLYRPKRPMKFIKKSAIIIIIEMQFYFSFRTRNFTVVFSFQKTIPFQYILLCIRWTLELGHCSSLHTSTLSYFLPYRKKVSIIILVFQTNFHVSTHIIFPIEKSA